jgi:hypothetical protein
MDGQNGESICPTTGKPIFVDLVSLPCTAPIKFVCPACRQVHAFHASDGKVSEIGLSDHQNSN